MIEFLRSICNKLFKTKTKPEDLKLNFICYEKRGPTWYFGKWIIPDEAKDDFEMPTGKHSILNIPKLKNKESNKNEHT